ncbi:acyl-CoA-binding protein [Trichoderma chlorosporum]
MSAVETPEFIQAQEAANAFTKKPTNDELLRLYALFKIGKGFDLSQAEKPGMFNLQAKAKLAAWTAAYEDEGIKDPQVAQEEYVKFVESLKAKYA